MPAVSTVGLARDRFAFHGNGLVEMSKRRSLGLFLAQVGLDLLSGHHDTGLVLFQDVDILLQRLLAEKGQARWEGWEAIEWGNAGMAVIGVGEFNQRVG